MELNRENTEQKNRSVACNGHANDNSSLASALRMQPSITMGLLGRAISDRGQAATRASAMHIYRPNGKRKQPSVQYIAALEASLADLLQAGSYDPPRPCFRPMSSSTFAASPIGYYPFKRVMDDLEAAGFVTIAQGYSGDENRPGFVTRIVATLRLFDFLSGHGILARDRAEHFDRPPPYRSMEPIKLKAGSIRNERWDKIPGRPMLVPIDHPVVTGYAQQVRRINEHIAMQMIDMVEDISFFRGFNLGDLPAYKWNKGGRLYPYGGSYQSMHKTEYDRKGRLHGKPHRKLIRINDEATIEDDIKACHITIAHGILGVPLPARFDLYDVPGIDRNVVKFFCTMVLGAGKIPTRWTNEHRERFDELDLQRLNREYPIKKIAEIILDRVPVLHSVLEHSYSWADFQFIESEIMINTVHDLAMKHGVTCLPVHDSFIIPISQREIGQKVLTTNFKERTGLIPTIE